MTTLSDRPNTALLVIDVQNGVIGAAHERAAVVANVVQTGRPGPQGSGVRRLGAARRRGDAQRL